MVSLKEYKKTLLETFVINNIEKNPSRTKHTMPIPQTCAELKASTSHSKLVVVTPETTLDKCCKYI